MFSQVWVLPEVWQDTEVFDTITLIFDMSSTNGQVIVHLQPLHNPHMNKELGGDGPCYFSSTWGLERPSTSGLISVIYRMQFHDHCPVNQQHI